MSSGDKTQLKLLIVIVFVAIVATVVLKSCAKARAQSNTTTATKALLSLRGGDQGGTNQVRSASDCFKICFFFFAKGPLHTLYISS